MTKKTTRSSTRSRGRVSRKDAFLAAYVATASIVKAAKASGIDRTMHYRWLLDAEYADAFANARREAGDTLESEAVRRAHDGVFEPNVWQGEFVYPQIQDPKTKKWIRKPGAKPFGVVKRSDALMMFLLRGHLPERYGKKVEVTGEGGGPIESSLTVTFVKP